MPYNGWTNHATWAAALHISNDQGWQERIMELAAEYRGDTPEDDDLSGYADAIRDDCLPFLDPAAYLDTYGDVKLSEWVAAYGGAATDVGDPDDVDWHDIASTFMTDTRSELSS